MSIAPDQPETAFPLDAGIAVIRVQGARTHNLKDIDLELPRNALVVFCGASGSGKTSMAIDTLYAEGQRRYIESFSAYTRQFLEQLDKPDCERIDGLPPAIAVTRASGSRSNRATIATATEVADHLRLLFARVGRIVCPDCSTPDNPVEVRRDTVDSIIDALAGLVEGQKAMLGFEAPLGDQPAARVAELVEAGYVRALVGEEVVSLADLAHSDTIPAAITVVVDRFVGGRIDADRLAESIETAISGGDGACVVITPGDAPVADAHGSPSSSSLQPLASSLSFDTRLRCNGCSREFASPEPPLFNFNSPLGACPECEGFGSVVETDMDLVVPDKSLSLRQGAIAPWRTPAYEHELAELIALAPDYGVDIDAPYAELPAETRRLIVEGVPERDFGGLNGFIQWLERRKYKMHLRVFLSRWRSYRPCPACHGDRLKPEALAVRVGGKHFADICRMEVREASQWFNALVPLPVREGLGEGETYPFDEESLSPSSSGAEGAQAESPQIDTAPPPLAPPPVGEGDHSEHLTNSELEIARAVLVDVASRLRYLEEVGVGYLTLDRTLRTLSTGEAQRVAMTATLGSNLVDMLYVLDEPSTGLHPVDVPPLVGALRRLRDRGNTVLVVEHEEEAIRAADHVVEFGPLAGVEGGQVVFEGPPDRLADEKQSRTGDWLSGRRMVYRTAENRRPPEQGRLTLLGATGANLAGADGSGLDVEIPLGVLTVVTGVSGAGKSSLVRRTLFPALESRLHDGSGTSDAKHEADQPLPYRDLLGWKQLDDVVFVDQSPISRSPRSNPVTYVKAMDPIRALFADLPDAKARGYTASHFSFNVDGGRCEACQGAGYVDVDMQFLADVTMRCHECEGRRFRDEVLDVRYRDRDIAEVLEMTVHEAIRFFRGETKIQQRLRPLVDVGLDYLQLGQPASTLSGGEAQRLKLAGRLSMKSSGRTLFLLDEPTTGLHFSDVEQLVDCFNALVDVGHSLVVIEHNVPMMMAADWIVDLGPGAAADGGRVVAQGSPETVAQSSESATGRVLAEALARRDAAMAALEEEEDEIDEEE